MGESGRGGRGGLLSTFTSAVLERTLARVREWLRTRLGPGATLGALELDGARVRLFDARVPIGRFVLEVRRATLVTAAEELMAGGAPVRLEHLEGRLVLGPGEDAPAFVAPLELRGRPGTSGAWIDADAVVRGARARLPGGAALAPLDGTARIRVDADAWAVRDAELAGAEGRLRVSARGRLRPPDALEGAGTLELFPDRVTLPRVGLEGPTARFELSLGGTARAPRVEARTRLGALRVRPAGAPSGAAIVLRRVRGHFVAEGGRRALRLDARSGPGALLVEQDDAGPLRLLAQRLDTPTVVGLAAILSGDRAAGRRWLGTDPREARLALPADAQLWADLELGDDGLTGRAHLETGRSRLSLAPLRLARDGRWDGTILVGLVAFADAVDAGLLRGRALPQAVGTFDLTARVRGAGRAAALEATLSTRSVAWVDREGRLEPLVLRDLRAELSARAGALELRALRASAFGGRVSAAGALRRREGAAPSVELSHLSATDLSEGLGRWLLRGRAGAPEDLALDLELSGRDGAFEGRAQLRTAASHLDLRARAADGRVLEGSTLEGVVATADLAPWLRAGPVRLGAAAWALRGALGGTLRSPELSLDARAAAQDVRLEVPGSEAPSRVRSPEAPRPRRRDPLGGGPAARPVADGPRGAPRAGAPISLRLSSPRLQARLDAAGLSWSALEAGLLDGRLRSCGVVGRGGGFGGGFGGFGGLAAEVELEGLRLAALPLPDGATLGRHLAGRLDASLRLWARGRRRHGGRVRLTVAEPRYPVLARLGPTLAKRGLPRPPTRGDEPLVAVLRGRGGRWRLEELRASVPGLRLTAAGALTPLVRGEGELVASAGWLARGRWSPLARAVDALTVPWRVAGTLGAPRLRVDLPAALARLLAGSELGRGLKLAVDRLLDGRAPAATRPRLVPPTGLLGTDVLLDRVAADAGDADEALAALLERGLSPLEIAARLRRRRRRA